MTRHGTVVIEDNTKRTVSFTMNNEQIIDALFMWLLLKGVELPSTTIKDYGISINTSYDNDNNTHKAVAYFTYSEENPTRKC